MHSAHSHSASVTSSLSDHKHVPAVSTTSVTPRVRPSRVAPVMFDKDPLPVSIQLIRDGKIRFDDLPVYDLQASPIKGRGEVAQRQVEHRMLAHLFNMDVGRCRGRRCMDISGIVHAYYGGPAGVAAALASAPPAERQAAARFLGLASHSPNLNLQYEPVVRLNRGVQALAAVADHFDKAVAKAQATVGAAAQAQPDTPLPHETARAYAHGRLHAYLRDMKKGLEDSKALRAGFHEQLTDFLDGGEVTIAELDALIAKVLRARDDAPANDDAAGIETKSGSRRNSMPNPLELRFLTPGSSDEPSPVDDDDTVTTAAPVTQHGDIEWLVFNGRTRPLMKAAKADAQDR